LDHPARHRHPPGGDGRGTDDLAVAAGRQGSLRFEGGALDVAGVLVAGRDPEGQAHAGPEPLPGAVGGYLDRDGVGHVLRPTALILEWVPISATVLERKI